MISYDKALNMSKITFDYRCRFSKNFQNKFFKEHV